MNSFASYDNWMNESIKHLTPKSYKELKPMFDKLSKSAKLITGIQYNHPELIKDAIKHGANIHAQSDRAFRYACSKGNLKMAKWLLNAGSDIHIFEDYAIRIACKNGHKNIVKWLLDNGADIHVHQDVCMYWAKRGHHKDIVKLLKKYGIEKNIDSENKGELYIGVKRKVNESIKHLTPRSQEEILKNIGDLSPEEKINTGIHHKYIWLIKKGIEEGADVNTDMKKYHKGRLLRSVSGSEGNWDIAKILIDAGADVNLQSEFGNTALHFACEEERDVLIKLLLKSGANPNIKNKNDETPIDIVKQKITFGSNKEEMKAILKLLKQYETK